MHAVALTEGWIPQKGLKNLKWQKEEEKGKKSKWQKSIIAMQVQELYPHAPSNSVEHKGHDHTSLC